MATEEDNGNNTNGLKQTELKRDLKAFIDNVNDNNLLEAFHTLLTKRIRENRDNVWNVLSENERKKIEDTLERLKRGEINVKTSFGTEDLTWI